MYTENSRGRLVYSSYNGLVYSGIAGFNVVGSWIRL